MSKPRPFPSQAAAQPGRAAVRSAERAILMAQLLGVNDVRQ